MAIATINKGFKRSGKGNMIVLAHPATNPGTSLLTTYQGYMALIYQDTHNKTLKTGVSYFAETDDGGLEVTVTQEPLTYNTQDDKDAIASIKQTTLKGKCKIYDADPAHWATLLGSTSSEILTQVAASGIAGRTQTFVGGSMYPLDALICWRMPSKDYPGEFDHYLFTCSNFVINGTEKLNANGMQMIEIDFTCKSDPWLMNPDTGMYEKAIVDFATAAATA
jgi:hypothetical protein